MTVAAADLEPRVEQIAPQFLVNDLDRAVDALAQPEPLSLLDLRGLGKEAWRDVDAAEHVERERETWD